MIMKVLGKEIGDEMTDAYIESLTRSIKKHYEK